MVFGGNGGEAADDAQGESASRQLWRLLLTLSVTLLILLAPTFLVVDAGTATHAIAQLTAIVLGTTALGTALLLHTGWSPF